MDQIKYFVQEFFQFFRKLFLFQHQWILELNQQLSLRIFNSVIQKINTFQIKSRFQQFFIMGLITFVYQKKFKLDVIYYQFMVLSIRSLFHVKKIRLSVYFPQRIQQYIFFLKTPLKIMYRISFTRVQFLKQTTASHIIAQVETQHGLILKTKPKIIKNNVAKFYGDFIELDKKYLHFCIKILQISERKSLTLREKINFSNEIFDQNKKKSHILQNKTIKIYFQSEKILNLDQNNQEMSNDFSARIANVFLFPRVEEMRRTRQLSSNQRKNIKRGTSAQFLKKISSKSFSLE